MRRQSVHAMTITTCNNNWQQWQLATTAISTAQATAIGACNGSQQQQQSAATAINSNGNQHDIRNGNWHMQMAISSNGNQQQQQSAWQLAPATAIQHMQQQSVHVTAKSACDGGSNV